jgi:hypothetical protein
MWKVSMRGVAMLCVFGLATGASASRQLDAGDAQANKILDEHPAIARDLLNADRTALQCHNGHFSPLAINCTRDAFEALRKDLHEVVTYHYFANLMHEFGLGSQLDECGRYELAGDKDLAYTCRLATINAADYLVLFGISSHNPPITIWISCGMEGESSMEMMARCMVAAGNMDACAFYPNGALAHEMDCRTMLSGGNWVANPQAQAMRFDKPHPAVTRSGK